MSIQLCDEEGNILNGDEAVALYENIINNEHLKQAYGKAVDGGQNEEIEGDGGFATSGFLIPSATKI